MYMKFYKVAGFVAWIVFGLSSFFTLLLLIIYQAFPVYIIALMWWCSVLIAAGAAIGLIFWWISRAIDENRNA